MPAQLSDIDQIRKKRRRKIVLGRALLLIALTLAGVGVFLVKDRVSAIDIGGFFRNSFASIAPGPGFPLDYAGGEQVKGMYHAGRCLVLLTDSNVTIYNQNGRMLRDIQHKYSDPVVQVNGVRILIYDRGGKRLRVESLTDTVAQKELDYPIYVADISKNGDVAVVTGTQHYNAELAVYDKTLAEASKFTWKTPDQYPIGVSFTTDGKGIAAAAVSAQGGDLVSKVRQYRLDTQDMAAETEFAGELIHSIRCVRGGVIAVTDARTVLLDAAGGRSADYSYNYAVLSAYSHSDDGMTALVFGDYLQDKTGTLVVLDAAGQKKWERKVSSHAILMSIDGANLGLVSDGKLILYNELGQEAGRQNLSATPLGLNINGSYAYLVTPDSIQKLSV